jgi:hypothetical protein
VTWILEWLIKYSLVVPVIGRQLLASVTVIVYVIPIRTQPEHKALAAPVTGSIVPLGAMEYIPPAIAVTIAVPSQPGTQLGSVLAVILITGEPGVVS